MTMAAGELARDLSALLLPLAEELLIVPSAVVVEIIRRRELLRPVQAPAWLLGMLHWHETLIPVLSFETLNGGVISDSGQGGRIVVMSTLGEGGGWRNYAILARGVPHLLLMTAADVHTDPQRPPGPVEQMKVRVHGRNAAIPDLDALEAALLQVRAGTN